MQNFIKLIFLTIILLTGGLILVSCGSSAPATSSPTPETPLSVAGVTETPQSTEERTLVYCVATFGQEGLYPYKSGGGPPLFAIHEAIYDGPIDNHSFDYQPVILKKIPSLADGDAQLLPVDVAAGDRVVDVNGAPVELEAGVRLRPSGCQADDCAVEYDGSAPLQMDQLVVRFELLPGLLWSDGEPLTASDSVYSFNLQSHPDTPVAKQVIERTASYQALDELTAVWTGLPGYLDGTYFTNFYTPAPEHAWGHLTPEELLTAEVSNETPLGWGPYVVEAWDPETGLSLTKNENYFRSDEGLPHFDRLVFRFEEDNLNAKIARLLSGECDVLSRLILTRLSGEEAELVSELSAKGRIRAAFVASTSFEHLDFGIQPASYDDGWQPGDRPDFFGDVRVRRAFALCMDRQRMLEAGALGQTIVPSTYIPPQHPLYNPDTAHYEFDPAAGAALLEEAGWVLGEGGVRIYAGDNPRIPPGTRISLTNDTRSRTSQELVQVMADSLAGCGIEITTSYWASAELFAGGPEGPIFGRQFELAQFYWGTGVTSPCNLWLSENIPGEDTSTFPSGWLGQNNPGFSHPEYDQACRNAILSLPGQPGYVENHLRAQEIFAEQLPVILLNFAIEIGATRADFCGYILDPTENVDTWNIEEFNYGPDC